MSAIAGFGAGAAAAGFSGFAGAGVGAAAAAGAADLLSPAGGFASSSAMIRRIDARISSIEGSWTFAGCVISDSKSSTPSYALFYTKHDGFGWLRLHGLCNFRRRPHFSPDQRCANHRAAPPLLGASKRHGGCRTRATNRLAAFIKAMSWQLTIASNGRRSGLIRSAQLPPCVLQRALDHAVADEEGSCSSQEAREDTPS
jgi:hypothetical protein